MILAKRKRMQVHFGTRGQVCVEVNRHMEAVEAGWGRGWSTIRVLLTVGPARWCPLHTLVLGLPAQCKQYQTSATIMWRWESIIINRQPLVRISNCSETQNNPPPLLEAHPHDRVSKECTLTTTKYSSPNKTTPLFSYDSPTTKSYEPIYQPGVIDTYRSHAPPTWIPSQPFCGCCAHCAPQPLCLLLPPAASVASLSTFGLQNFYVSKMDQGRLTCL